MLQLQQIQLLQIIFFLFFAKLIEGCNQVALRNAKCLSLAKVTDCGKAPSKIYSQMCTHSRQENDLTSIYLVLNWCKLCLIFNLSCIIQNTLILTEITLFRTENLIQKEVSFGCKKMVDTKYEFMK